jgi:phage shock protein PspC (stress-responsive transcriptional regulator)
METDTTNESTWSGAGDPTQLPDWSRVRPLVRPRDDRMLAGVAAGLSNYLAVDVTIVRIVLAVLCLVGGAGIPIYLAGWLLIPEEGSEWSIAAELLHGHSSY